jgi:hypothetical protein
VEKTLVSNEAQPDDAGEPDPAARTSRIPTWVLWLLLAILVPSLIGLGSKWFYTLRPLPTPRQPAGDVTVWNSAAWARVPVDRERCYLANNEWNSTTPGSGLEQEIFVQDFDGHPGFGWRWRAPWQMYPAIIAYPEVVCGLKPWDVPMGQFDGFPFLPEEGPGARRITADFHIHLEATGTYNMSFSLWAVSGLPATPENIRTEIMIWNVNGGQRPAGTRRGELTVGGVTYDVWVNEHQRDASGLNPNTWTYVAFVARKPVLDGPLEISSFLKYALENKLLTPDMFVTDLELGNEVAQGAGIAEIRDFNLRFIQ